MPGRVLIVDDDRAMCELLETRLGKRGFEVEWRTSTSEAHALLGTEDFDVVVTDLHMPGEDGIALCGRIVANRPDVPVVVITAFGSLDTAVAAIRAGAYDFVTKPFEVEALALALDRATSHRALREEVKRLREATGQASSADDLIGKSPAMARVHDLLRRIADADTSVLLTGESGTGKEVVARALHRQSRRRMGPFVAINCAALPPALLESELFGHARGAFTDAKAAREGLLVQASGGSLFLDEIGDMPLELQPKLLRALEERKVRPVGGSSEVAFDARVIAATNVDIDAAVEQKRFREDLYFRINVLRIELPPLRTRGNDVLLLAQRFLGVFAAQANKAVTGISSPAAARLLAYSWPGNVRELKNCIERAVALTGYEQLTVDDLPDRIRAYKSSDVLVTSEDPSALVSMAEVERRYVLRVLEAVGGHRTQAAKILGIDRKTLYRKLEEWGLDAK